MKRSLLAIHIGPVQEFIAAARRTADLWAGSQLLLEVTGAAASIFADADRIFPVDASSGGANRILTFIEDDPAEALGRASAAARRVLSDAWAASIKVLSREQRQALDLERGDRQVEDFLTVMGAWTPCGPEDDYADARNRVEQLLRGRKATRAFEQTAMDDAGLPKSPLDPSLPTIRKKGSDADAVLAGWPLFLKKTETLDAISLIKRVKGVRQGGRVLSTRTLAQRAKDPTAVDPVAATDDPDADEQEPDYPYFAILVADGDGMGALLDRMSRESGDGVGTHRRIAFHLDQFADAARSNLLQSGQVVYCGGDDVMAFLPVPAALRVAEETARLFQERMDGRATLSAGIAVVHYREPLSVGLARARSAEQESKRQKNAVTVAVHTRAGSPRTITRAWGELELLEWQRLFSVGAIPSGLPYELTRFARDWPRALPSDVLCAEVRRVLDRKPDLADDANERIDAHVRQLSWNQADPGAQLLDFTEELVISRFLAGAGAELPAAQVPDEGGDE